MLRGRFGNTTGRPYLEGRLVIPRLRLSGDLSFIVDTGADVTYLTPGDAQVMGVDTASLVVSTVTTGVGGTSSDYTEPAILVFADESHLYIHDITLRIAGTRSAYLRDTPSLLGRDVLDRWRMMYCRSAAELEFEVLSCEAIAPRGQSGVFQPGPPFGRRS